MKECQKCKQVLDPTSFSKNIRVKDGLSAYCKPCATQATREWVIANPAKVAIIKARYAQRHKDELAEKRRKRKLANPEHAKALQRKHARKNRLKAYSLSESAFLRKLEEQDGGCAICAKPVTQKTSCVDHCHGTGLTRGILCIPCNFSLGHVERPGFLEKALAYLERHRSADKEPRDNRGGYPVYL